MNRGSYSLLMCGFCTLILFGIFTCGAPAPELELTSHMDNIVSIIKEYRSDAASAASALEQYINNNLAEIKNLVKTLETRTSSQKDESELNVDMIFKHTRIIEGIMQLEEEEPALMNDARIEQALKPLFEVFKDTNKNE
ncbi:MAG: hypothetical protein JW822_01180 [Spirochaetales bacterium]|nr:hypothetical protein [Spirochaetales bacterium]